MIVIRQDMGLYVITIHCSSLDPMIIFSLGLKCFINARHSFAVSAHLFDAALPLQVQSISFGSKAKEPKGLKKKNKPRVKEEDSYGWKKVQPKMERQLESSRERRTIGAQSILRSPEQCNLSTTPTHHRKLKTQ
jgi:hypothetical protein